MQDHTQSLWRTPGRNSHAQHREEKVKRTRLFEENLFFFSGYNTAHADRELTNNFLLPGWHFHTSQFKASWAVPQVYSVVSPGAIFQSPGNTQQAEVKLRTDLASKAVPCSPAAQLQSQFPHR